MSKQNETNNTMPKRGSMGGRHGGGGFEKSNNFKLAMSKLINYLSNYKYIILFATLLAFGSAFLTLYLPDKLKEITNLIAGGFVAGIDMSAVIDICLLLVVLISVGAILQYAQGFIMTTVSQRASKKMRSEISHKINKLPLKFLDEQAHGQVLSVITNDVDTISQTLNNSLTSIISAFTLIIGSLVMMFVNNWILALSAIGSSLIGLFLMGFIMKRSQKYFISQQQSLGEINGQIEEVYSGHNIVKVYGAEKQVKQVFDKTNNKLFSSAWKSQFFSGIMFPLMSFVGNLSYVVVCVVGSLLTLNGYIDFGVIVAFILYVRFFSQPLGQLAQAMTGLQSAGAASERVFGFLEEKELEDESKKTKQLSKIKGNVEFKGVKFGYEKDKLVINNFSAKIKAGQKVAIVGPTGAGKTTLVNLLMRFYEINEGDILIDGVSVKELTRENVHQLFSMVLQDTWLFDGTIYDNIVYATKNVTKEQVEEACKSAGVHHFIQTLPNGYQTVLNESLTISAGQKQLLTIARAMVQNSPMLILDEATSSVDTRTEILIQQAMDKLTKGRTSFVIAHRLSTIKNADVILVLNHGDIVEQGNHEQLIAKGGFYAELYNSQFEEI